MDVKRTNRNLAIVEGLTRLVVVEIEFVGVRNSWEIKSMRINDGLREVRVGIEDGS